MTQQPLEDRDILRFRMISDPQVSPDGHQVAFVLIEQDAKANRQASSIWVVPADGSAEARRVTAGPHDSRPRWAPDATRLAFLSAREREWAKDLYVLNMAGGEPCLRAKLPRGITEFAWSPDGASFCLVGGPDFPNDPDREPAATPDEARQRYQERVRHVTRFRYRMDGQGVLDDEARQLWVVGAPGEGLRMLTDGDTDVSAARWAPDGRIAFLSNREPDRDTSGVTEVYAVAPAGGQVEPVARHGRSMSAFSFSPDGQLATLRTDSAEAFSGDHVRLWVGDACLTRALDRTCSPIVLADTKMRQEPMAPIWAGGRVYFEVSERGCIHLYRARVNGSPELVLGGERVVSGCTVGGEHLAFISTSPDDPLTLRVADLDGGHERVLFEPNPWMRERALGTIRPLDFAHAGRDIQGWALLPPGHREGERVPTLLYIHGGPHAAYGWSFQFVFQQLAGAGFAVVFCNPPGSQSYSEEFARSLRGAWGELDFPVLMTLVDKAVDAGFADPDRLGVGGASYGGYATLWTITHTNRFKAAVSMRPVSALQGFYGSSDIGWNFGASAMGAEPWEDPERYRRLSPITHLEHVTTPLRLIAGTGDLRTPAEQAENVFVRLHKMGREVDLVVFHGEPHAMVVQGKPWNRVRHMRAVIDWFQSHLSPANPRFTGIGENRGLKSPDSQESGDSSRRAAEG